MLKVGEKLWNGAIVTAEFAAVYNRLQERIQRFRDDGLPVPEQLLNGSHNLMNSVR
jgi:hypothetical protein